MHIQDEAMYDAAEFFKVFGDYSRLRILCALMEKEMGVGEITDALGMTQPAVSHQLRVLRQNGLVKYRKDGKAVIYALDDSHVSDMLAQGLEHVLHKNKYEEEAGE